MYQNIHVQTQNNITTLTINRPEKLNALNLATINEIDKALTAIEKDKNVRGAVITGSGEKAFIAGADISEITTLNNETGRLFAQQGQSVFNKLENLRIPVIAAVNGFALGAGCELALACHMRIASENARFGQPEVNLGIIPGFGGTQRLPRLVGTGMAMELCLSGNPIDAREALRIGLVNRVTKSTELYKTALELLGTISQKGPLALRMVIECINQGRNMSLENALQLEAEQFGHICGTEDMKEGTKAFLEKRAPQFMRK